MNQCNLPSLDFVLINAFYFQESQILSNQFKLKEDLLWGFKSKNKISYTAGL